MKKLIILTSFSLLTIALFALDNRQTISQANKAYTDGLYNNALDLYKQVLKEGYESADLYYNIGNVYYKMNDFTSAILYYEKAKKLNPGNEDIEYNLKVANSKIADKIEPLPELFYRRWYISLTRLFSSDTWAKAGIIAFILTLVFAALYVISRILTIRKVGFWLAAISLFMSLFCFHFAYQNYRRAKDQTEAIIFSPTVTIKSSPDEKSIDLFVLHEGTKVWLIDQIGGWFEIKISNGSVGWLPSASVERI
jgi:tetratricopeptide (TPR) repeat protein